MSQKKHETSADKKKKTEVKSGHKLSLHNLYDEFNSHLRVLDFYKGELKYLKKRLEDIASRNSGKDILAQVEQFQNQFILTRGNIDELNHTVKSQLKTVEKAIKKNMTHSDEKTLSGGDKYSKAVQDLEKDIALIKHKFNTFLAKYM